jgi:hemin uptake protein HemP
MRVAAQIFSIFGGIVGMFSAIGVLVFGGPALLGDAGSWGNARLFGLVALIVALLGIVGGIAIAERPKLALPLLLLAAGVGFALLGWGWFVAGVSMATGALLTILSDPDRRPRHASVTATRSTRSPSAARRWVSDTLLRPQQRLGFGGGVIYVLVVILLVFGAVELLGALPGMMK